VSPTFLQIAEETKSHAAKKSIDSGSAMVDERLRGIGSWNGLNQNNEGRKVVRFNLSRRDPSGSMSSTTLLDGPS